jgi:hypothetical protein
MSFSHTLHPEVVRTLTPAQVIELNERPVQRAYQAFTREQLVVRAAIGKRVLDMELERLEPYAILYIICFTPLALYARASDPSQVCRIIGLVPPRGPGGEYKARVVWATARGLYDVDCVSCSDLVPAGGTLTYETVQLARTGGCSPGVICDPLGFLLYHRHTTTQQSPRLFLSARK